MEQIIEPTPDFNFSKVSCSPPNNIGGSYFTKLFYNNKPIYIQTPKSLTKQGVIVGKKMNYTDLLFSAEDTLFIQWLEELEERCQHLIFENTAKWFENAMDKSDIESAFNSIIKIYRSGKNYLVRSNIKHNVRIYDELNNHINQEKLSNNQYIISILEIQGIKFTARNFQVIIEMKQAMIVSPDPFLDECFIKTPFKTSKTLTTQEPMYSAVDMNMDTTKEKQKEPNETLESKSVELSFPTSLEENGNKVVEFDESITNRYNAPEDVTSMSMSMSMSNQQSSEPSNIMLDIEDSFPSEYEVELPSETETIKLKKPNQVYYDLYRNAREKAKRAKQEAIMAYLEAKQIKNTHNIDLEDEDSESDLEYNIENLE